MKGTDRGYHNRINHGDWRHYGDKQERKERRKLFKSVRHKLLMHIPLTAEEDEFRRQYNIEENTRMACTGYPLPSGQAHGKWVPNRIWAVRKYWERHYRDRVDYQLNKEYLS